MQLRDNFGIALQQVSATLSYAGDQLLQAELGIGMSQFRVLTAVQAHGHCRQKDIAARLGQTEASISRQVRIMDMEGLLRINQRPDNRRERLVSLTPRGDRVARQAAELLDECYQPVFAQLDVAQKQNLAKTLQVIQEQVQAYLL